MNDQVLVFDVNETLLDLGALDPVFERVLGRAELRRTWFQQMLQLAFRSTITGPYVTFGACAMAALELVAGQVEVDLADADRAAVRDGLAGLPPHPEVGDALTRLRDAGVRIATLTNSTAEVAEAQLTNAGIRELFEQSLSADDAGRLKPAPEPYLMAAERLGVPLGRVRLVAAHAWDVTGALRAGADAAFVARPGQRLDSLVDPWPDLVVADIAELADRVLAG
jgi:2-haloacid dehalogenase